MLTNQQSLRIDHNHERDTKTRCVKTQSNNSLCLCDKVEETEAAEEQEMKGLGKKVELKTKLINYFELKRIESKVKSESVSKN